VYRVAQKNGACANGVNILTGTTKLRFSRIRSSVIPYPNGTKFTVELALGGQISNVKKIPQAVSEQNFVKILGFFLLIFLIAHFA